MDQTITIVIDGADGVLPDSVGNVLRAVFGVLKSMDQRSWAVQAERIKWKITEASLVNPLTISAKGIELFAEAGSVDLVASFVKSLQQIDRGERPQGLTDRELKQVRTIAIEARRSRSLTLAGGNGQIESVSFDRQFVKRVNRLIREPIRVRTEYGSLDGTLIQLANDPLKDTGTAKLRERQSGMDVACNADPATTAAMAHYVNRKSRVVIYGDITYENDVPHRVHVESFTEIPGESGLPSLEDLHAMKLRPPSGMSVEDYLDELRGDD